MTQDTKILKLSSGEEIICNVVHNPEKPYVSVVQPMKLNAYPKATKNGLEEALALQKWIHFSETDTYDVPKSQIIVLTQASYGLSKFYEYCVKKATTQDDYVVLPPTNQELKEIEDEEMWEEFGEPDTDTIH